MKMPELNCGDLQQIKDIITSNLNKKVVIKQVNKQNKVLKQYKGEILACYDNLFLVKVENYGYFLNKTFTYTDFLTNEYVLETGKQD